MSTLRWMIKRGREIAFYKRSVRADLVTGIDATAFFIKDDRGAYQLASVHDDADKTLAGCFVHTGKDSGFWALGSNESLTDEWEDATVENDNEDYLRRIAEALEKLVEAQAIL